MISDPHESLQQKLEKCELENKAQSEFLSVVIHQLRAPLAGNKWIFKMLLDGDLGSFTDEQKKIIEKGFESTERMIKLLQEVIVAHQNNRFDFEYKFSKIDLEHLLEGVVAEFLEEARVHDVHIILNHPETTLPLIEGDPEKLAIVFQNLLENGIKYNKENGTITLSIGLYEDWIHIEITDTGIGIPASVQEKIFTKFFRADNAKEKKREGSGLGLFTAKNIIEKHKGRIWFESKHNEGTTFYVELPTTLPLAE